MSRLAKFCDRFIEVGWLAALVLTQLYPNPLSHRGASVGKQHILRVIVLFMVAAWIVEIIETRGERLRDAFSRLWKNRLVLLAGAYLLGVFLTSVTSVSPTLSFYGSFERLQGFYSALTYASLFFLMVLKLRSWDQFHRVVSVILLSSIPIALYAIAQELGLDPTEYYGARTTLLWEVRSTMGNHIFLGAYLIMVMPLTLGRLFEAWQRTREGIAGSDNGVTATVLTVASVIVLNLLLTIYFTYYRFDERLWWLPLPILTAYLSLLIWTLHLGANVSTRVLVFAYSSLFVLQGIALVLTRARGPWIGGLVGVLIFGIFTAIRWRMRRFLAAVAGCTLLAAAFIAVLNIPNGPLEPLKRNTVLKRLGSFSQFERDSGAYRIVLWQSVWKLVSTHPQIGTSPDRLSRIRPMIGYGPETLASTIEKVLHPKLGLSSIWNIKDQAHNDLLNHLAESGLLGLLLFIFLLAAFYAACFKAIRVSRDSGREIYLVAIFAALTAHLAELQFGIGITSTRMLFWLLLAQAVVLSQPLEEKAGQISEDRVPGWRSWMLWYALGVAIIVLLVLALSIIVGALAARAALILSFVGTFIGLLFIARDFERWSNNLGAEARASRNQTSSGAESFTPTRATRWNMAWLYAIALGAAGFLSYQGSLKPILAEAYFSFGQTENPTDVLEGIQRASAVKPKESAYQIALGNFLMRAGVGALIENPTAKPPENFKPSALLARTLDARSILQMSGDEIMGLAEASFDEARRLQPLDPRYVLLLAHLNHYWGLWNHKGRLDSALRYYQEAHEMMPTRVPALLDWALALAAQNRGAEAFQRLDAAESLAGKSFIVRFIRALVYYHIGKPDQASKELEIFASEHPKVSKYRLMKLFDEAKLYPSPLPEPLPFEELTSRSARESAFR